MNSLKRAFVGMGAALALAAPTSTFAQAFDGLPPELQKDILVWIIMILILYFFPAFVAIGRSHRNATSIFVVNLFFGWTLLGWVICLAWAFSSPPKIEIVTVEKETTKGAIAAAPASLIVDQPKWAPVSAADQIKKLKDLLDGGAITQGEFDALKADVLKSLS